MLKNLKKVLETYCLLYLFDISFHYFFSYNDAALFQSYHCDNKFFRLTGGMSSTSGIIQSILKEGESQVKMTVADQSRCCSILCTSEYCLETTEQLQDKLKEKVKPELSDQIDMSNEQDLFHK